MLNTQMLNKMDILTGQPRVTSLQGDSDTRGRSYPLGGLKINYLLIVFIPLLIGACLYSYHMAVKQKQQKPFPSATITATACHYPQDIEFRFFMMIAGGFINLVYFIIFKWLKLLKRETEFPFSIEGWLYYLAQVSVIGFYCAVATIDGHGTTKIHGPGAVFFFIVLLIVVGAVTIVLREMKSWCSSVISDRSRLIKTSILIYLIGVLVYCIIGLLLKKEEDLSHDDKYVVIIEWNLALGGLTWLFFFIMDWGNVSLTLQGSYAVTVKMIVPEE